MLISVFGKGCFKCEQLHKNVLEVVERKHIDADVEYVTDIVKIAENGILCTPALMIDNKIVSSGHVLSQDEILEYINSSISI